MSKDKSKPVVALLVADLHLSLRPPAARDAEPNWLEAQGRLLKQLRHLTEGRRRSGGGALDAPSLEGQLPVICAGDLFDRWNPPPELLNWAIANLPHMYAVPGQHDLPCHSLKDLRKTGYYNLVQAGVVTDLKPGEPVEVPGGTPLRLHGFPWGVPVTPLKEPHDLTLEVAVIHAFVWTEKTGYSGALSQSRLGRWKSRLDGYDVAVFGDNHKPFRQPLMTRANKATMVVYNCGGFQRRRSDEKTYRPSVGLLHSDGSVTRHYLNVSQDKFSDAETELERLPGMNGVIEELGKAADDALDFAAELRRRLSGLPEGVRTAVLEALEGK